MTRFDYVVGDTLDRLHKKKTGPIDAIPTPFPSWNNVCEEEGGREGVAKGWLVVLGGVTGTGKSYLALNLAAEAVLQRRLVGNVNFEMSENQVVTRYLSALTGIPKYKLSMGDHFNSKAWAEAKQQADLLASEGGSLITNDSSVFGLEDVEEAYGTLVGDHGVEMMIVDYAQLVSVGGTDGIFQRSEAVAGRLRELTHEYNVVTVAVSQFNREEAKKNGPPTIHGLMGGGVWEHAANQIMLLNHTVRLKYKDEAGVFRGEFTELLGAKNRHGLSPFTLPMRWTYDTFRFNEYEPGTDPRDPWGGGVEVDDGKSDGPLDGDKNLVGDGALTGGLFDDEV